MRTLQEKYNAIQEGKFSKDHFLAEARMQQPQLVTRFNGYDDAVQILKNKGMIVEVSTEESFKDYSNDALADMIINSSRFEGNEEGIARVKAELERRKQAKLNEVTAAQEKYRVKPSAKPTQFKQDIAAAKKMIDAGKSEKEVVAMHGQAAFNAVNAQNLGEAKQTKLTKKSLTDYRYKPTNDMDKYPYEQILRGLRVELESMKVTDTPTAEEYQKAIAKVAKNLEKDSIFYTNQLAGFNPNKKRTDVMTPVDQKKIFKTNGTKGGKATDNKDVDNGMKKVPVTTNFTIVKEGIKKVIKSILKEDEDWDKSGRHIEYGVPEHGDEDDLYDLYGDDEENLDEGPAQNNPKIQKLVDGINDLIR
jgi:hypothetical protein